MKPWKVILATLVIFVAGLVTGAVGVKWSQPKLPVRPRPVEALQGPFYIQKYFLSKMERELSLNPQQVKNLDKVFADSRERIRGLWNVLEPEMQEELTEVEAKLKAELTPDQLRKFEELRLKSRPGRQGPGGGEDRRFRGRGSGPGSGAPPPPSPQGTGDIAPPMPDRPPPPGS